MKVLCFNVSGAKNCLGFIKARTGAYIIAILGIIYGIFSLVYILFCLDDNMITKEIEKALRRVDKDISNIHEVYIIYCYIATTVLSTINSCFLLLGLVKNSPILLTTWLIIAGIGNWVSTVWIVNKVLGNTLCCISLRRCCIGMETRVFIQILTHPCYPINVD